MNNLDSDNLANISTNNNLIFNTQFSVKDIKNSTSTTTSIVNSTNYITNFHVNEDSPISFIIAATFVERIVVIVGVFGLSFLLPSPECDLRIEVPSINLKKLIKITIFVRK